MQLIYYVISKPERISMVNPFVIVLACIGALALLILFILAGLAVIKIKKVIASVKAARGLYALYTMTHNAKKVQNDVSMMGEAARRSTRILQGKEIH